MTPDVMDDLINQWRLIFVRYCSACRCNSEGFCYRHMKRTQYGETCEDWAE